MIVWDLNVCLLFLVMFFILEPFMSSCAIRRIAYVFFVFFPNFCVTLCWHRLPGGQYDVLMQYCISTTIFTMILKFCQIEVLGETRSTNEKKIRIFIQIFKDRFLYNYWTDWCQISSPRLYVRWFSNFVRLKYSVGLEVLTKKSEFLARHEMSTAIAIVKSF